MIIDIRNISHSQIHPILKKLGFAYYFTENTMGTKDTILLKENNESYRFCSLSCSQRKIDITWENFVKTIK